MNVAAYVRYSSENQRQESIDAQLRAIKDYCDKNSYNIVRIYQDEALSATTDQRDQFLQLIDDSKLGTFKYIVVHKLDRFARNRYDSAFYKRELRMNDVSLLSVMEQLDDSPESVILESVLEGMAEYFSKNLSREVKKGLNENALQARHNGGRPPLGYDVNKDLSYKINDTEAESVRIIFEMYANDYGYGMICDHLNLKGYKTKIGKTFGKNSIYEILRNEKYIGRYTYNKRQSKKNGNHKFKSDDQITRIDDAMPRIISDELWNNVQFKLNSNIKPRMNAQRVYLLTGKLECGKCGCAYVGSSYFRSRQGKKYYNYQCVSKSMHSGCDNKPLRADYIEQYVMDRIQDNILSDSAIDRLSRMIYDMIMEATSINRDLVNDLKRKRDGLKIQVDKLFDLYLEGMIDKSMIGEKTNRIKAEIESYEKRISELGDTSGDVIELEKIKLYMYDLRTKLDEADDNVKKAMIDVLVDRIIINADDIEVIFKVDPFNHSKSKSAASVKSEATQDKVGGDKAYLTIPFVFSRLDMYDYFKMYQA